MDKLVKLYTKKVSSSPKGIAPTKVDPWLATAGLHDVFVKDGKVVTTVATSVTFSDAMKLGRRYLADLNLKAK
jgi:hypothetical protein